MWEYIFFTTILCQKYKFSFSSIGTIPIEIASSCNPPLPLSSLISSWHQGNLTRVIHPCMRKIDNHEPWNKPCNPFIGLDLDKVIHPITIVHVTEPLVLHRTVRIDESLQRIRQIILVTEVKVLVCKHCLQTFNVNFILARLLMP